MSTVSLYDARPFFEKALQFGVQRGIIDQAKLEAISAEAPKGMVQIAAYFGSEFLRPELEKAKDRIVNLVSLFLEDSCNGDLQRAAEWLRDHSFLSCSKGGSTMLKQMIGMPQTSHFGMNERRGFTDDHIPQLAKWSLRSLADYQAEMAQRRQAALVMEAAIWLAGTLEMDEQELEEAGADAEAVIRTALLTLVAQRSELPSWGGFDKMVQAWRKKPDAPCPAVLPKKLPAHLHEVVDAVRQSVVKDWPKVMDPALTPRKLFNNMPAFMGRYFWTEGSLSEVVDHDRSASQAWKKVTGGHNDEGTLITLFLSVATGTTPKSVLTEKGAATLVRRIRKTGIDEALARRYIEEHAPVQHQEDYLALWTSFMAESRATLLSDSDYELKDALALLRRECTVKA